MSDETETHHVRHQLCWISTDVEELDTLLQHKLLEGSVSAEPNPMTFFLQAVSEGDEGLDVACRVGGSVNPNVSN
jgi:hypothetical protein